MRTFTPAVVSFLILGTAGCSTAPNAPSAPTASPVLASAQSPLLTRQLIIKFKANTFACDATSIARLAAETGVSIDYLRPMSGGACVVRQFSRDEAGFREQQDKLLRHPAIETLEQDRVMKTL